MFCTTLLQLAVFHMCVRKIELYIMKKVQEALFFEFRCCSHLTGTNACPPDRMLFYEPM